MRRARSRLRRLIEQSQRPREIEVWILRDQARDFHTRRRLRYQDGRRLGVLYLVCVFGIRQKSQVLRTGMLHAENAGDLQASVAHQFASQRLRDCEEFHTKTTE